MRKFSRRNKILSIGILLSVVIGLCFLNYPKPVGAVVADSKKVDCLSIENCLSKKKVLSGGDVFGSPNTKIRSGGKLNLYKLFESDTVLSSSVSPFLLTGDEIGFSFLEKATKEFLATEKELERFDIMEKHTSANPPAFKSEEELDQFRRWQVAKDKASSSLEQSRTKLERLIPVLDKWFLVVLKHNGGSENWAVGRFVHNHTNPLGPADRELWTTLEVKLWKELQEDKRIRGGY
ncbi:MAG: hypothetical protein HYW77_02370 [Parcubacteria group bacterium]|nr:hypothetical protein [Parcubacteria group bacterium]